MPRLNVNNLRPGVVLEIGPHVRVTVAHDRHGLYLGIDAPADFKITRVAPGTTFNGAARVCPRCTSPVKTGRPRCGACGKDMGGIS